MSDEHRVSVEITRELLAELQRLGLSDDDILAVVNGRFESDEQAQRIAAVIEADDERHGL